MKNRKGFTIVELVIVIAVIAILAAVLIPTFSGVIQRANESSALQKATSAMKTVLAQSKTATIANGTYFISGKTEIEYVYEYDLNKMSEDALDKTKITFTTATVSGDTEKVLNTIIVPVVSSTDTTTPSSAVLAIIKEMTGSTTDVAYVEVSTLTDAEKGKIPSASVKAVKVGDQVWGIILNADFAADIICLTYSN